MIPTPTSHPLAELEAKRRAGPPKPLLGSDQFAAVNLMPLVGEVQRLMGLGAGAAKRAPKSVYPGGMLPPGDILPVDVPKAVGRAVDPATGGQMYLPGTAPAGEELVQGAVPGMYNVAEDPNRVRAFIQRREELRAQAAGLPPKPVEAQQLDAEVQAELRRRGYSGHYDPVTGTVAPLTPVDLTGAAPNIDGMRKNLNLEIAPSDPEIEFAPRGPWAQVNTETVPGATHFADRYKGYETSPEAAAMLHSDYERLLRNPDGSSVVANLVLEDQFAPVRQAQGYFQGQKNPVSGARIEIRKPPPIDPSMPPTRSGRSATSRLRTAPGSMPLRSPRAFCATRTRPPGPIRSTWPMRPTSRGWACPGTP